MSVPKPTVPLEIRHAHGRDYRAIGGLGRMRFCPKKLGNFTKSKDYLHIPQDIQGVKMARSVGQRGALQSESQDVSPPWTHENADNQRTCHLTSEQTAESGKNPKKSPKATS